MHIILNTEQQDLNSIFQLFDSSIIYQEKNNLPTWKNYDKRAIQKDIEDHLQFKIVIENKIALVFSICYTDPIIWREMDKGESIYLHRIVVNPEFKGQKLFSAVLDWSIIQSKQKNLKNIRMDTWASNSQLIAYYQKFGFYFIEFFTTPDTAELPIHNRKLPLALLEYPLN